MKNELKETLIKNYPTLFVSKDMAKVDPSFDCQDG